MYLSKPITATTRKVHKPLNPLQYGQIHEQDAVDSYIRAKIASGNIGINVWEVGTIISKERPGYGASLDRRVYDPLAKASKEGGLEVKCPSSKEGLTTDEACRNTSFCMEIRDGKPKLKIGHKYYYQVQGQMYVCEVKWVDFAVWLGGDTILIDRIYFNKEWWVKQTLPKIDYFYKRAFLPEVFTRRVERNIPLYKHSGWKPYRSARIVRM